eukprot:7223805-Alexandrium_andersonii.AAC.1
MAVLPGATPPIGRGSPGPAASARQRAPHVTHSLPQFFHTLVPASVMAPRLLLMVHAAASSL